MRIAGVSLKSYRVYRHLDECNLIIYIYEVMTVDLLQKGNYMLFHGRFCDSGFNGELNQMLHIICISLFVLCLFFVPTNFWLMYW